jgi:hypothetical protein
MSWSLKGSYVETCSCDLMCPCNMSFDHGATYDYAASRSPSTSRGDRGHGRQCLKVVAIADTPKV